MCSPEVRKEANRLNWMVKGQLITKSEPDSVVEYLYDSYFKRLWGNHERSQYADIGFEEAYKIREQEILTEEMESVAHLGYD
jgi:ABC-type glutathione transport system ATPase component